MRASGPPADLLARSARRLQVLALLYAFIFFMAGVFPALPNPADRARFFSQFTYWGPGAISITVALLVAFLARRHRLPLSSIMTVGLLFEVTSSFGIAAAEFLDPTGVDAGQRVGLSWVAVWVLLYAEASPQAATTAP